MIKNLMKCYSRTAETFEKMDEKPLFEGKMKLHEGMSRKELERFKKEFDKWDADVDRRLAIMKSYTKQVTDFYDILGTISVDEMEVLSLRYIKVMPWEEVADEMNYSRAPVFRIHDKALRRLDKRFGLDLTEG